MGAVTYPEPRVVEFLSEHFVPVKVETSPPGATFKAVLGNHWFTWAPVFVYLAPRGRELRRTVGFYPPDGFLAELRFVLGMAELTHSRQPKALEWFSSVAELFPETPTAPEALFWAGAVAYKREKIPGLVRHWDELRRRYPESEWATKADVVPQDLRAELASSSEGPETAS